VWKRNHGFFNGGFQMEDLRIFGNMVEKLSNEEGITPKILCENLNCTIDVFYELIKGYIVPTVDQLNKLAEMFKTTPEALLTGDREHYEQTVVHCMHDFSNTSNREEILDIIENYATLASVLE